MHAPPVADFPLVFFLLCVCVRVLFLFFLFSFFLSFFLSSSRLDVKETLDLDFPNLPFLLEEQEDGATTLRLTQSTTILRHVGRKYGLYGVTLEEQARCDLVLDTAYDFKSVLVSTAYSRNRMEMIEDLATKSIPHYFGQFEALLMRAHNKSKWFASATNLTIADFFVFEMIDQSRIMVPTALDAYPLLSAFIARFLALPPVQAYRKSAHFIERPINNMSGFQ